MGRLIDTDVLIKQIWRKHKETEDSYDLCVDELKEVFCGIVAIVDELPTAYAPDKIEENLKKEFKKYYGDNWDKAPYLVKAIEIVKGGGVDG